ncbi:hypothetical protein B0H14DRAFT_3427208 [Mycena olivaceomarginata]|nr:hypothetical protein B0H14DRAFT_3427208 [Mycena olivaceomarginata]
MSPRGFVRVVCATIHFKCEDLHAYFSTLADPKQLPSSEDLEATAWRLYDMYASTVAQTDAMLATDRVLGQRRFRWKRKRKSKNSGKQQPKALIPPARFYGDHVISDSTGFLRDASISREAAAAVAEGDVGRVWEAIKFMLFNFAAAGLPALPLPDVADPWGHHGVRTQMGYSRRGSAPRTTHPRR